MNIANENKRKMVEIQRLDWVQLDVNTNSDNTVRNLPLERVSNIIHDIKKDFSEENLFLDTSRGINTESVALWCGLTPRIPICHRSMVSIWVEIFNLWKMKCG